MSGYLELSRKKARKFKEYGEIYFWCSCEYGVHPVHDMFIVFQYSVLPHSIGVVNSFKAVIGFSPYRDHN